MVICHMPTSFYLRQRSIQEIREISLQNFNCLLTCYGDLSNSRRVGSLNYIIMCMASDYLISLEEHPKDEEEAEDEIAVPCIANLLPNCQVLWCINIYAIHQRQKTERERECVYERQEELHMPQIALKVRTQFLEDQQQQLMLSLCMTAFGAFIKFC